VSKTSKPRASFSHCSRAGFSASGQFNRSDFGIDFNAPIGLDGMLVSDKVSIE
jgi:polyisoprenoid-binding protein YceI